MPRPAMTHTRMEVMTVSHKTTRPWAPPPYYTSMNVVTTLLAHRTPETVVNPKILGKPRPMSPWSHDFVRIGCPPVSGTRQLGDGAFVEGEWNPWPVWSPAGITDTLDPSAFPQAILDELCSPAASREWYVDQVAKTKLLNKISQQKMQLGVTMLEMKQTVGLVRDLAVSLVNFFDAPRRAKGKASKGLDRVFRRMARGENVGDMLADATRRHATADLSLLTEARDKWMQYAFGIKPLLGDVDNATSALVQKLYEDGEECIIRAKAGHSWSAESQTYIGTLAPGNDCSAHLVNSCQVHYSVVYVLPTTGVPYRTLLGLDNPWGTLYEYLPASWIVDYAVGFGDWFNSFTGSNGLLFKEGCRSSMQRAMLGDGYFVTTDPGSYTGQMPRGYLDVGKFRRTLVSASGLVPGVVPKIKTQLGGVQLGQAIFALTSWLGGKPMLR